MAITSVKTGSSFTNLQKYNDFLGPNLANANSATWLIQRTTVGAGGSATVTFSSIPQTYTHLQVRAYYSRSTAANGSIYFNADNNSANYRSHYLEGNGASVSAGTVTTYSGIYSFVSSTSWGGAIIDILDYTNTNKNKVTRILSGIDNNGSGYIDFNSGAWYNTSAITSITCNAIGGNFPQYSSFALYGMKG